MANKTVTEVRNPSTGTISRTVETDGVRTTVTAGGAEHTNKAASQNFSRYSTQKVWNPATSTYITVTMTGNEAQDEVLMAAAFNTAGSQSKSLISQT